MKIFQMIAVSCLCLGILAADGGKKDEDKEKKNTPEKPDSQPACAPGTSQNIVSNN